MVFKLGCQFWNQVFFGNIVEKDIRNLIGITNYMSNKDGGENISVDNNEKES